MNISPPGNIRITTPSAAPPNVAHYTLGPTTYIVARKYKQDAKEGLMDKLIRLIKNDIN